MLWLEEVWDLEPASGCRAWDMYPLYEDIEDLDVRMDRFRGFKRVASGLDVPKHVRICWIPHGPGCAHQQYHHGCFTPHSY